MRKTIFLFLFFPAILGLAQDSRFSIQVFGGACISLPVQDIYSENVTIINTRLSPRFSGTENMRLNFRLSKAISFIVGYGHSRTGARPSFYISDSILNYNSGVNYLSDFTKAFDLGLNLRVIEKPRWNINASLAFSIGETKVGLRGNKSYINFGDTVIVTKATYIGVDHQIYAPYKSIKFSLGTEYKLGKLKTSAITFDVFFNHGFNKLGTASTDARLDDKYIRANIINMGSYVALTLGIKKYFQIRPF